MKRRSLFGLMVSLAVLGASSLSVVAQSQRVFKKDLEGFQKPGFFEVSIKNLGAKSSETRFLTPPTTSQKQSQSPKVQQASAEDISAILNLVRGWGSVENIFIIDNYAILSYAFGQNGATVAMKRENGRWRIIYGRRQETSCGEVSCLVNNGFPRNIATQFINQLQNYFRSQQQEIKTFRQAWSKTNISIAPFLGYWRDMNWPTGTELAISIWPSYTVNKVCVVGIAENSQYVNIGRVSGKKINTPNNLFTLEESTEEGEVIHSRRGNYLVNPAPLNTWYFNAETKRKLQDAGCTNSLPRGR